MSALGHATAHLRLSPSFLHIKAWMSVRQGEPASKGAAAPAKKVEPAAKKAPDADHQPPAPAPAPGKSRHGRKPQRDQQSANQALQLFSHLQQYRVGVPCSSLTSARIYFIFTHRSVLCLVHECLAEYLITGRDLERVNQEVSLALSPQPVQDLPAVLSSSHVPLKKCTLYTSVPVWEIDRGVRL